MKFSKIITVLCCLSCFNPNNSKNETTKAYSDIWESQKELKKQNLKLIKNNDQIIGYVQPEYAEVFQKFLKIDTESKEQKFKSVNESRSQGEKQKSPNVIQMKVPGVKQTNNSDDEKNITTDKTVKGKGNSSHSDEIVNTNNSRILNFSFSDFKYNQNKKSGSFKVCLEKNTKIDRDYLKNLICHIEILEGKSEDLSLTIRKNGNNGNNNPEGQSLLDIKNSFVNDKCFTVNFSLKCDEIIKVKIFFLNQNNKQEVFVVKNGDQDFFELQVKK